MFGAAVDHKGHNLTERCVRLDPDGHKHHAPRLCPVGQNGEIAMLGEITHLQAIIDDLTVLTTDPHKLPPASEQVSCSNTWLVENAGRVCEMD